MVNAKRAVAISVWISSYSAGMALGRDVGLAAAALFALRKRRLASPLLDLRLFTDRSFSNFLGTLNLVVFAMAGTNLSVARYVQMVVGLPPPECPGRRPNAIATIVSTMLTPSRPTGSDPRT